jgi:hypothetical protein
MILSTKSFQIRLLSTCLWRVCVLGAGSIVSNLIFCVNLFMAGLPWSGVYRVQSDFLTTEKDGHRSRPYVPDDL